MDSVVENHADDGKARSAADDQSVFADVILDVTVFGSGGPRSGSRQVEEVAVGGGNTTDQTQLTFV